MKVELVIDFMCKQTQVDHMQGGSHGSWKFQSSQRKKGSNSSGASGGCRWQSCSPEIPEPEVG